LFKPWFDRKQEQQDEHGLALGFKAWFLVQAASESMSDSDDATGSIYRLQGSWTAFSGDSGQVGRIEWRAEKRSGPGHALTLGLGWAKPSKDTYGQGLSDEYVTELSYRFQLTKNIFLLPDIQLVFTPALNPDADRVWVLGFRASLAL
jgi:hypothetical protein